MTNMQTHSALTRDIATSIRTRTDEERLALKEQFATEGYIGPFKLSEDIELDALLQERYLAGINRLLGVFRRRFLTWYKSLHEKSVPIIRAASAPDIVDRLQVVLGDDILLWGSQFIAQGPNGTHNWHLDAEYGCWNGATLWLGLKNLSSKTTLSLITHSQLLQTAPQELKYKLGVDPRDENAILQEAKKLDPRCELKTFVLNAGEFVIWSGRVWHATLNQSDKTRFSIILQYCTPDNTARIPLSYGYPDTKWSDVRPPCVMVRGDDTFRRNVVLQRRDIERRYAYLHPFYSMYYKARRMLGI